MRGEDGIHESLVVERRGAPRAILRDAYYRVLRLGWGQFIGLVIVFYLAMNSCFAFLYWLDPEGISNNETGSYWRAFIFSFQTSTTIGYGHLFPRTTYANCVVIADTLTSLISIAIVTGLVFAKFSRPHARVLFTKNALIAPVEGEPTLVFRVANGRATHIVDASVSAVALMPHVTREGLEMRKFHDLEFVRQRSPIFALSWLVFHVIDESSPLHGMSIEEMVEKELLIIISLTGIDEVFAQTVHARHTYSAREIVRGAGFADMLTFGEDGTRVVDFRRFDEVLAEDGESGGRVGDRVP